MAATTAVADSSGDLCRFNPFLSDVEADGVTCSVLLLMMSANRISHVNLALQQSRSLLKLLNNLKKSTVDVLRERIRKELLSQSENLAATLASRRHYGRKLSAGSFEIDPRFLLFEFCHGLLLRGAQVHLVRKLLGQMDIGQSVCHQVLILMDYLL